LKVVAAVPVGKLPGVSLAADAEAVWVPSSGDGTVSRVDPRTNRVIATIPTGGDPSRGWRGGDPLMVATGGGQVWVTVVATKSIARINPQTNQIDKTIPIGMIPFFLAVSEDSIWVSANEDNAVLRIDLQTGQIIAKLAINFPGGIAVSKEAV